MNAARKINVNHTQSLKWQRALGIICFKFHSRTITSVHIVYLINVVKLKTASLRSFFYERNVSVVPIKFTR